MTTTTDIIDPKNKLDRIIQEQHIEPVDAQALIAAFQPLFESAQKVLDETRSIVVTDATEVTKIKASRVGRLKLREIRCEMNSVKNKMKERALREGNAVQGIFNLGKLMIEPEEERLEAQEKFAERKEAERKAALRESRMILLAPHGVDPSFYNLADMPEETFTQLLTSSQLATTAKAEAAKKEEAARIAAEKAKAEENARIRADNERLRLEKEAVERAAAEERKKAEAAKKAAEAAAREEREAIEAKAVEERRVAAESARVAAEKARKERESAEAEARKEREAREKMEQEISAKKEAEQKAKKQAERAPDKAKLLSLSLAIKSIPMPTVKSGEAQTIVDAVLDRLSKISANIELAIDRL